MGRRNTLVFNPTNFIRWRDNLSFITQHNMTLVGMIRLLIDQATGAGTLADYPVNGDIFWPSQQLYDAGNEVLADVWPQLGRQTVPLVTTNVSFTVTTATDIYAWSTNVMIPSYVAFNGTISSIVLDQKYWTSDLTKLEQWGRNWRSQEHAQPKWFILWDASHLRVFPTPDATYVYTLTGIPWPPELGTGTEDITMDSTLKLGIAYASAAILLEATRPEISDAYTKEAEEILQEFRIALRNSQTNNIQRLKPGSGVTRTDLIMAARKGVIQIGRRLS